MTWAQTAKRRARRKTTPAVDDMESVGRNYNRRRKVKLAPAKKYTRKRK